MIPLDVYEDRAGRHDLEAEGKRRTAVRYGWARLAVFLAILATAWGVAAREWGGPGALLMAALVVAFVLLVAAHRRARKRLRRVELMADFNREMGARALRDWEGIPEPPPLDVPPGHDYARDLDLTGPASLRHLAGSCATSPGWATLDAWLAGPATPEVVGRRQRAVEELAADLDFREAFAAEARLLDRVGATGTTAPFFRWAAGPAWLVGRRRWLVVAAWILPLVNVAILTLWAMDRVPAAAVWWSLIVSGVVQGPFLRAIHGIFAGAEEGEAGVRGYGPVLELLAATSHRSEEMATIRERLGTGERPAHAEIGTLRRLLDMAEVRRSPLFHLPLAALVFWDVHVLVGLERWRARAGRLVEDWIRAMGEAEALAALAGLRHANPDWSFPRLVPDTSVLEAEELGHPLLPPDVRVSNDVGVGPPGRFLLVTGSNMSGKSTLLRAVGLNAVLAQAGAPVCARSLTLPPLRVCTSMRVDDSLSGGVSFFMAELRRLKHVVDAAEAGGEANTLYLLDEILQGTNTAERRVAARTVIRRLLASGAIGAVTTHDLTLADADDLVEAAVPVHFTETVASEGLSFDYRLRPGVARSTNALKLLRLVGLGGDG